MTKKEESVEQRILAAETLAYLIEISAYLQRVAAISNHLISSMASFLNWADRQDNNNVVVPNATVTFVADSGVLSAGSVLSDEGGRAQTVLGAGGDTTPRPITVTASSEGVSESITVSLVNARLVINGPAEVFVNAITEYTVRLTDDGGNPIARRPATYFTSET